MSDTVEQAESDLPFLRRYARAVTGTQPVGDALADNAFRAVAAAPNARIDRLNLFAALDTRLKAWPGHENAPVEQHLASDTRRAILLTALEGFTPAEAAHIMRKGEAEFAELLNTGDTPQTVRPHRVFIIEDEPLVSAHIAQIVRDMGHTVMGSAASGETAIAACHRRPPDLLLADVMLADGLTGINTVEKICLAQNLPVVFITAYAQRLLRGHHGEPAYLIEKPFTPDAVEAVISQVQIRHADLPQ